MKLWLKIFLCVFAINLVGGLGAIFTVSEIGGWYAKLEKPPGVPPNWIFGPVWTLLYTMLGVAIALVWHRAEPGEEKKRAVIWFFLQMVLNVKWTPVFFTLHWLGVALGIIVVLLIAIIFTIRQFRRVDKTAAMLLIPYLVWVCYATYLNAGYWWLNG